MGTGVFLLALPSIVVHLLFGVEISGISLVLGRFGGICLVALSVACWPGNDARWPFYGMLTYTDLVMIYLLVVGTGGHAGILLWPAVLAHASLTVLLLLARFRKGRTTAG
jgi:hypothetical protein